MAEPSFDLESCRRAARGAAHFLKDSILSGRYGLACRGSDGAVRFSHDKGHVFVGFFLARALGVDVGEIERSLLLVRILSEENEGLWGFSPPAPYVGPEHAHFVVDADDTAYVLRTLRQFGVNRSPARLLQFHRIGAGGFVTFAAKEEAALVFEPRFENNLDLHPEVNANVFLCLEGTNFSPYIRFDMVSRAQSAEGWWRSYFYPSRYFATHLFLELAAGKDFLADAAERGVGFLLRSQGALGGWGDPADPYETALALAGLAAMGRFEEPYRRGARFLLGCRQEDGGWRTDRVVWEYHDRGGDVWRAFDEHRAMTTALVLWALRPLLGGPAQAIV